MDNLQLGCEIFMSIKGISIKKEKIYPFSLKGFNTCLVDINKQHKNNKEYIFWIMIYIILFTLGFTNSKWLINCIAGLSTSKIVKYLMN